MHRASPGLPQQGSAGCGRRTRPRRQPERRHHTGAGARPAHSGCLQRSPAAAVGSDGRPLQLSRSRAQSPAHPRREHQTDEKRTDDGRARRTSGQTDDERMDGWTDGRQKDERVDRRINGRADGRTQTNYSTQCWLWGVCSCDYLHSKYTFTLKTRNTYPSTHRSSPLKARLPVHPSQQVPARHALPLPGRAGGGATASITFCGRSVPRRPARSAPSLAVHIRPARTRRPWR